MQHDQQVPHFRHNVLPVGDEGHLLGHGFVPVFVGHFAGACRVVDVAHPAKADFTFHPGHCLHFAGLDLGRITRLAQTVLHTVDEILAVYRPVPQKGEALGRGPRRIAHHGKADGGSPVVGICNSRFELGLSIRFIAGFLVQLELALWRPHFHRNVDFLFLVGVCEDAARIGPGQGRVPAEAPALDAEGRRIIRRGNAGRP